jgi:NAD(P)-dependent dehydrogenase (short-subunit alcohol dehydrogenase family)
MSASSSTDLPSPIPLKGSAAFITDGGSAANSPSRTDWLQLLPVSRSAEGLSRRRRRQPLTFASRVDAFSLNLQTSAMRTAVRRAIDIASQAFGWVGITVACAARDYFAPAETITAEGFRTMIDIDLPDPMGGIVNTCGSACFRRPPFQLIRSVPSPPTG